MTSEEQAREVEGMLAGFKRCAYCKSWQPEERMTAHKIGQTLYTCKASNECSARLWDSVRDDRERSGRAR